MSFLELVSVIIGVDVGLCGVAAIFAGAWVKASRVDKLEAEINALWGKINKIDVLESKIEGIEEGIRDIKHLLQDKG